MLIKLSETLAAKFNRLSIAESLKIVFAAASVGLGGGAIAGTVFSGVSLINHAAETSEARQGYEEALQRSGDVEKWKTLMAARDYTTSDVVSRYVGYTSLLGTAAGLGFGLCAAGGRSFSRNTR